MLQTLLLSFQQKYYPEKRNIQKNYSYINNISVGKLKGCKAYETAKNKHCPGTISKGKFVYTYSGKIKSTSEKVKIRGIWKQGKCTAYGPWSKTKSVKIKGNK